MSDSSKHHPHSQWTPTPIEIRLPMDRKSIDSRNRFYLLISEETGYSIPLTCSVVTTSRDKNSYRISFAFSEGKPLSFYTTGTLKETSIVCSKLNMSHALACKITAKLSGDDALFTITAPSKSVERTLLANFAIFEFEKVD